MTAIIASMEIDRAIYTARGALAYHLDRGSSSPIYTKQDGKKGPHIVFNFWYAPEYHKAKELLGDLKARFSGDGLPIGVGLFVRPMGDVIVGEDLFYYSYNPQGTLGFLEAAVESEMPIFINTCGMQWTEVAYAKSPLIRMLERRVKNQMRYEDGTRVQRKLQPPANYLPGAFLRSLFRADANGVVYFSNYVPLVQAYRERSLHLMAEAVAPFAKKHPELWLGISTENEVDFPGVWITGGKKLAVYGDREMEVKRVLKRNVEIFQEAGLARIYTNQSVEDAENRGSPLSTTVIDGSEVGITVWRTANHDLYRETQSLAQKYGRRWAIPIMNPLSLSYEANVRELKVAIDFGPDLIGVYCWWPHFWGYDIKGLPLERAIKSLTR